MSIFGQLKIWQGDLSKNTVKTPKLDGISHKKLTVTAFLSENIDLNVDRRL